MSLDGPTIVLSSIVIMIMIPILKVGKDHKKKVEN